MSQVKLNLQPPPNVEFVTGYPGIPPGPERAQAAVKGAIEVRIPPQGVKAKWVRIELRKVETLPGGGPANTFYDFVGPSPVNLWSSPDEYSLLRAQDFPFSIRIPESIPPTISLDNRAGIGYELVASICTKGKRGFLRKAKSVVVSTISSITIDKHELHSTWPVYCQPETRQISQDGVNLSVQRKNTCYGPGDRIAVSVVVKSDTVHTIILRTLELSLKETTVFRAGGFGPGKKSAPQERQLNIAEGKQGLNMTLYGGSSHSAELSCMLSPAHTTPTLNAARHIDVTYTLCIKALFGTGGPLVMELPVIVSNWQRTVSYEAISRIGPAPSLSLFPASQGIPETRRPAEVVAATLPLSRSNFSNTPSANTYTTLPISSNARRPSEEGPTYGVPRFGSNGLADEFGSTRQAVTAANTLPITTSPNVLHTTSSNSTTARRPDSSGGGNRFTVTNAQPQDISHSTTSRQRSANATGSGPSSGNAQRQWPTAEEEKMILYEKARAQVARVQGPDATPPPASHRASPPPQLTTSTPPRVAAVAATTPTKSPWKTAEEEKLRLFQEAQAAVQRHTAPTHTRHDNSGQPSSGGSGTKPPTAAAALYAQGIKAQNRPAPGPNLSTTNSTTPPRSKPAIPQYATADEEKAALKKYEEAKLAVNRSLQLENEAASSNHTEATSAPIAYESLFPGAGSTSHPPPASPPTHGQYTNALEEKEALRKKFEARDNAQAKGAPTPQLPPKGGSVGSGAIVNAAANGTTPPGRSASANAAVFRPTPLPPVAASSRVLTAAEEKALLRAKLEARDANRKPAISPNNNNLSAPLVPSTPPPLMPRPPVEYIKETQEEDARVSRLNGGVPIYDLTPDISRRGTPKPHGSPQATSASVSDPTGGNNGKPQGVALDIKPFTPFRAGFDGALASGSSPPLPTKLAGE